MKSEIEIPKLNKNHYSLLAVEYETGIVLTKEFKRHLGEGEVFWDFGSYEKLTDFITKNFKEDIEFSIYNSDGEFELLVNKENINALQHKNKPH